MSSARQRVFNHKILSRGFWKVYLPEVFWLGREMEDGLLSGSPPGEKFVRVRPEPFKGIGVSLDQIPTKHGGRPMNLSERFQRFAAECEVMAKLTPNPENQLVWRLMAERWIRCAELCERQDSLACSRCWSTETSSETRTQLGSLGDNLAEVC